MNRLVIAIAHTLHRIHARAELHRAMAGMDDHMRSDIGLPPRGMRAVPNWRLHPYY
jgi:hypothetical protein